MVNPDIKIVVENNSGTELGEFENAKDISLTRVLSSVGELVFTIPKEDPKFSLLSGLKSHLKVVRNGTVIWKGNYDFLRENLDSYVIFGSTYEALMDYYLVVPDAPSTSTVRKFTGKKIATEIIQVLFNEVTALSNSLLAFPFSMGTLENPYTPSTTTEMTVNMEFEYDTLLDVVQRGAYAGGADFEITTEKVLNFYRRKGANKPNIVLHLKDLEPSNIRDFQKDTDFRRIGNDIYAFGVGVGVNFLKANSADATSQSSYGLVQRNLGIPKNLVDQATLNKLVADQINLVKSPPSLTTPKVMPSGFDLFNGWDLGDNVYIDIDHGGTLVTEYQRVIGVQLAYANNGAESIFVYLDFVRP